MARYTRYTLVAATIVSAAFSMIAGDAAAQVRYAVKDGESIELGPVYYIANCKSIMVGQPQIEILEGPPGVTLSIKAEPVLPRQQACAAKVPGGTVILTAKDIAEPIEAKLIYRVNYKTRDGDRQRSVNVNIALFPAVSDVAAPALGANAQRTPQRLTVKNDETIELHNIWFVTNCRSIMIGVPEIEVLEGPPELSLSIREGPVVPRRLGCGTQVPGGTVMLTAKGITQQSEAKLNYRVDYKTKDGPRQTSHSYIVSLFP